MMILMMMSARGGMPWVWKVRRGEVGPRSERRKRKLRVGIGVEGGGVQVPWESSQYQHSNQIIMHCTYIIYLKTKASHDGHDGHDPMTHLVDTCTYHSTRPDRRESCLLFRRLNRARTIQRNGSRTWQAHSIKHQRRSRQALFDIDSSSRDHSYILNSQRPRNS